MSRRDQKTLLAQKNAPTIMRNGTADVERSPFITEPVRLTPAWEANNLSNDELNFKGMTMERAKMQICPPKDRYILVFLIFVLHGLGTLMPWNMFITAKSYYVDFKLNKDYTGVDSDHATNFLAFVGFASQIPNLLFNWLNVFVQFGGNLTQRIVWSIILEVIVLLVTVILAMIDSSEWPDAFYTITLISLVLLNMANGIYQNTVYGLVAKLPIKYTGAVVLGSNISGVFTTVISILSSIIASSYRTAAIYYFITAIFILLLCFDTYFALPLNRFYRYHEMLNQKDREHHTKNDEYKTRPPYWKIFKECSGQLFNIFIIFFVSLSIFPAVHSDIKPSDLDNFPIPESLYGSITCYLTFNTFAMLGSLLTSWIRWPKPKYLVWFTVLRIVFIPFFLFCNYHPKNVERILPIYINNDWIYWSAAVLMSFSSGYLSSLAMMYAPQTVSPKYSVTAGMFAAAVLITGIFCGILFASICPTIVKYVGW